jgi:hypothetical protein
MVLALISTATAAAVALFPSADLISAIVGELQVSTMVMMVCAPADMFRFDQSQSIPNIF